MVRKPCVQPGRAAQLGGGADVSLQMHDVDGLTAVALIQPLNRRVALLAEVRTDPAGKQAWIGHLQHAVDHDHGNARRTRFGQHRVPALHGGRSQHNVVHALVDEIADGCDLPLLFLLGVIQNQAVAVFFRQGGAHALGVGVAPVALGAHLGEAHDDGISVGGFSGAFAATGGQQQEER